MAERMLQTFITNDPTYMENGYTVNFLKGGACRITDPGLPPQAGQIVAPLRVAYHTLVGLICALPQPMVGVDERFAMDRSPDRIAMGHGRLAHGDEPGIGHRLALARLVRAEDRKGRPASIRRPRL